MEPEGLLPFVFFLFPSVADELVFAPVLELVFDLPAVPVVVFFWVEAEVFEEDELPFLLFPVVLPFDSPAEVAFDVPEPDDVLPDVVLPDVESLFDDPVFEIPVVDSEVLVGVWLAIILSY